MSDIVIRAEGLGKKYLIGHECQTERYTALRDVLARTAKGFARSAIDMLARRQLIPGDELEEFWALKDVSFEIKRGDVVGIIGRNGAGKSTLLKVLSRITEPSEGRVEIRGRVASLLEVGTGFHPELTGRENIYLNGAILGMSRAEIKRKFDEIVAFAEVEKFLDTPVKRYSSGMYVRLAFAVAAHLEPEILVVDEVLAVGDAEFQKKCLGKMHNVAEHGRTVLFVSHNMGAVQQLCCRGMLLDRGQVTHIGLIETVIKRYSSLSPTGNMIRFAPDKARPSITGISIDTNRLATGNVVVQMNFVSPWPLGRPVGGIVLYAATGAPVWGSNGRFHPSDGANNLTEGVLRCESRGLPLSAGQYSLSAWLGDWQEDHDIKIDALHFMFEEPEINSLRPPPSIIGQLNWPAEWRVEETDDRRTGSLFVQAIA